MAGDWIKMRVDLHTDRAVIVMASKLKISTDAVIGKLLRMWSWADKESVDGLVEQVPASYVDTLTDCSGFAKALLSAGWLEDTSEGLRIPRFDRHNGESAKKRAKQSEEKRRQRSRPKVDKCQDKARTNVRPEDQTLHRTDDRTPDQTERRTREEKRREEKNLTAAAPSTQLSAREPESDSGGRNAAADGFSLRVGGLR